MTTQELRTLTAIERYCTSAVKDAQKTDWEQRRYEIAMGLFIGELTHSDIERRYEAWRYVSNEARHAVEAADILIAELKKSSK